GGDPFGAAAQHTGTEVQHPLMRAQRAVADVEGLVVQEQPDQLAVGDVDDGLPGLRQAVDRLGGGEGGVLGDAGGVAARQAARLPLVEVAPPADVPVGQREHRFRLRQHVQVQRLLAQAPWFHVEHRVLDHGRSSNSARSATTRSAPCSRSASACPTRSTPTTNPNWPARPAATPASASSKTAASPASSRSTRPRARTVSGAGLPRRCLRSATRPSMAASNRSSTCAAASTSRQLALEDTTARRRRASRAARTERAPPGLAPPPTA